jgi:hypothetical protein
MKTLGDELLASSPLSDNQNRAIKRGCATCAFDTVEKGAGLANELIGSFHCEYLVHFPN